jgi:hypothetical protein
MQLSQRISVIVLSPLIRPSGGIFRFRGRHNIWKWFHHWVEEYILEATKPEDLDDHSSFITGSEMVLYEVTMVSMLWNECGIAQDTKSYGKVNHAGYYRIDSASWAQYTNGYCRCFCLCSLHNSIIMNNKFRLRSHNTSILMLRRTTDISTHMKTQHNSFSRPQYGFC